MKISIAATLLLVSSANAFVPAAQRPFGTRVAMSEEPAEKVEAAAPAPAPVTAPAPAPVKAPVSAPATGGALVPIKEETVEFTAGLLGAAAGFAIGGPVFAAIAGAAANYASKSEGDISEVIQAVSKSSIQVFNYLANLDYKYEVLNKAKGSLTESLEKLKKNDSVDPETIKKVEAALGNTKSKITEINEEYDLVGGGLTALGVIGDLVEKAVAKAGELNKEYALSDKAVTSLKGAVDKAKIAADKATK
eukprot:CAMPEP_0198145128 /NCGR_PEP_ID=MMETSP1443-20131203/21107_1 /TAXON_ID=186043 /ORGANISM="Entomoneis sp., Strain CCMP2396" /LENGTH=248 /DNA_ID=CAMNT_0043808659 /DNA_START=5 /DNA_END=751 /DNA_ORIENTATION=+